MREVYCNMCGKKMTGFEKSNAFNMSGVAKYGSRFDGERFEIDLCTECLDTLISKCKITPIDSLENVDNLAYAD